MKSITLTDKDLVRDIIDFVAHDCDSDQLGNIFGQIFGFDVSTEDGAEYHCVPNANYCGHREA